MIAQWPRTTGGDTKNDTHSRRDTLARGQTGDQRGRSGTLLDDKLRATHEEDAGSGGARIGLQLISDDAVAHTGETGGRDDPIVRRLHRPMASDRRGHSHEAGVRNETMDPVEWRKGGAAGQPCLAQGEELVRNPHQASSSDAAWVGVDSIGDAPTPEPAGA